jgi:hypothetical protein
MRACPLSVGASDCPNDRYGREADVVKDGKQCPVWVTRGSDEHFTNTSAFGQRADI